MASEKNGQLIAAMICGLIGAILLFLGGLCISACASAASAVTGDNSYAFMAYVCGIGGGVVAIVGAALSLKEGKLGAILMAAAVVLAIVLQIFLGFSVMATISCVLLLLGVLFKFLGENNR